MTNKAHALKAEGRLDDAIIVYREIARMAPGNGPVLHNLAGALGDAGLVEEAAEIAEKAFATGLDAAETWIVYGRALQGLARFEEAETAFREVLKRRPAELSAHRELAQLRWMLTKDLSQAIEPLNAAIAQAPNNLDLLIARAQVHGQTGDAATEYAEVLHVRRRAGGSPMLELAAANSALAADEYEAAAEHAARAIAGLPDDPRVQQAHCRALLAVGDAGAAERIAATLCERFPLDQHYIALLATARRLLGDERYKELYDYDAFVQTAPLEAPKGWSTAADYLADLVAALDRRHKFATHPFGQSVRHGSQLPSIDRIDDPPLKAYVEAAAGPIHRYIDRVGQGRDPLRSRNIGGFRFISAWSIRLPASGFHIDHVHPQGWLSSACHLRLPPTVGGEKKAGWLKFGEPGIPTTPKLAPEHFVEPHAGVLAIFPSYMWHGTVPFEGEATRLTVAVDIGPAPRQ